MRWCAVDDIDLSLLGDGFVRTEEKRGIAEAGIYDKLYKALFKTWDHGPEEDED